MEIGIDSFAAKFTESSTQSIEDVDAIDQLLERIEHADKMRLDVFGIGEHTPEIDDDRFGRADNDAAYLSTVHRYGISKECHLIAADRPDEGGR